MSRLGGSDGMAKAMAIATFAPGGSVAVGTHQIHYSLLHLLPFVSWL